MKLDLAPRLTHRARQRATALVAATALISLAACSSGGSGDDDAGENDAASMSSYAADTTFKATEPVTFSMLWTDWPETPITDSWEVFDEIEKRTNVSLDLTNIPFSDAVEKRSLLISSGDAPDIIPLIYTGDEQQFAASGAVLPLSDYEEHMPNFRKYVEEWDLGDMVDNLRQADGKYYMTPGLQEVSVPTFTILIRKDIFDEVGAKVPETWDELRDGLEKIKAKYPDSTPLADGFEGASMLNYAAHAFGTVAGWGFGNGTFYDEDKGEFVYAATNDGYKDMVEYFHGLVEDGLLDTESFTAANDGSGTVTEKFAAGQVFAASGANGTVNDFSTALDATVGKGNYEVVQIAPPGGEAGQVVEPRNFWNGFMLTADAKNHPNFIAMLQFLDWLYYSPEARDLLRWGVEGETYTKTDGTYTLNPEYSLDAFSINPDAPTDILKDLGYSNDVLAGSTESRALKESYNAPQYVEYIDSVLSTRTPRDPFPPAPLDEAELEQASLLATPLKDTVDTNTLRFILGERPLSEWDTYVGELESQNLQGYLDLINGARERYADENG
ncbi:ABC transporter substrate-binding protein [Cellulomonas humilata]|uniref:Multiple sugar transport system substrate-binding protein/putative aldouronate transport system substrate-binding protein n=1 Tax=Cellulomonas humilata TaxID=144055 RepID=A0ABU0EGN1_9CELL|nr:extracellular solute-binding protein [Cellulomonas humilata]MDQ0374200.1 multiple sugar transport system substrate-binding protein/putative aldouronate transport system substrate-binding protein [Cellulomonas humilata]